MLKKRLVGVVTVKEGWAVQSMGYHRYMPLGKPECLVENLDRWGADEILVQVIDRSIHGFGPDFELLDRLAKLGISTPLIYAGGVRSIDDGIKVIQMGADRLAIDALLHDDPAQVYSLSTRLGAQAIIAVLPVAKTGGEVEWFDYRTRKSSVVSAEVLELVNKNAISEVMLVDWLNEGVPLGFDQALVEDTLLNNIPLIVFGGISNSQQLSVLLRNSNVAAVAIGNFLSYQEHAIQKFKLELVSIPLRTPIFESKYSSFLNV